MKVTLSLKEAQRLALHCQGLTQQSPFGKGKKGVLKALEQLSYIQIDTISVVNRAHHHTLWSRVSDYREAWLGQLQKERKAFEYWAHAASFLPMRDFRYSLPLKETYLNGDFHWFKDVTKATRTLVLDRIKAEGALQSKDFEVKAKRGIWYDWKPTKKALEQLYMEGILMVDHRKGFQKVYDLTERILPSGVDTTLPSQEEYAHYLIDRALGAHGFMSIKEIGYLRKGMGAVLRQVANHMLEAGELVEVVVRGVDETYYARPHTLEEDMGRWTRKMALLSPFDNMIIQRKRLAALFNYHYLIECYVPAKKRKYGYFCLPILHQGQFIGRLDPKADRKTGTFYVRSLLLEEGTKGERYLPELAHAIRNFASSHQCDKVVIAHTSPSNLKPVLQQLVNQ